MERDHPLVRLIALGIVGGVAKALFAPTAALGAPVVRDAVRVAENVAKHVIND